MLVIDVIEDKVLISFNEAKRLHSTILKKVETDLVTYFEKNISTVILNLQGIDFIDSESFNLLSEIKKKVKMNNAIFHICNASIAVLDLISNIQIACINDIKNSINYSCLSEVIPVSLN